MTNKQDWLPTLYTEPLSEDFPTDGDKLLKVVDIAWKVSGQPDFELDEWQRWLIRHVLETYPEDHPKAGELRYRQAVISVARQNGKSVLGAIFALYALVLKDPASAEVLSVAYTTEQAKIIYDRVRYVFENNAFFKKKYKSTGFRGITHRSEASTASYTVKSKAGEGLQGVPVTAFLNDELHLTPETTWDAAVSGTTSTQGFVLGITTAGDENSTLLKRLYEEGKQAAAGEGNERFGFFLWEAPEHLDLLDPEALKAANPAIACGRIDVDDLINSLSAMPEPQVRRYHLNQFVASEAAWLPMSMWHALDTGDIPQGPVVYGIDRSHNWDYATITANVKSDGKVHTKVIASLVQPTIDGLEELARAADRKRKGKWYMESSMLKELALRLRDQGMDVEYVTKGQMAGACSTTYALISRRHVVHGGDELLTKQVPKGVAKQSSNGFTINRRDSSGAVDSLIATILGVYGAEQTKNDGPMLHLFKGTD